MVSWGVVCWFVFLAGSSDSLVSPPAAWQINSDDKIFRTWSLHSYNFLWQTKSFKCAVSLVSSLYVDLRQLSPGFSFIFNRLIWEWYLYSKRCNMCEFSFKTLKNELKSSIECEKNNSIDVMSSRSSYCVKEISTALSTSSPKLLCWWCKHW